MNVLILRKQNTITGYHNHFCIDANAIDEVEWSSAATHSASATNGYSVSSDDLSKMRHIRPDR
jgi:hypothetical protein